MGMCNYDVTKSVDDVGLSSVSVDDVALSRVSMDVL